MAHTADRQLLQRIRYGFECVADRLVPERISGISKQAARDHWDEMLYWLRATIRRAEQVDHPSYAMAKRIMLDIEQLLTPSAPPARDDLVHWLRQVLFEADRQFGNEIRRVDALLWRAPEIPDEIDPDLLEWPDQVELPSSHYPLPQPESVISHEQSDGPVGPVGFRWRGVTYSGLRPKSALLVKHLWNQPHRTATFDSLAVPVYGDHARDVGSNELGSLRRDANRFFSSHKVPLKVKLANQMAALIDA